LNPSARHIAPNHPPMGCRLPPPPPQSPASRSAFVTNSLHHDTRHARDRSPHFSMDGSPQSGRDRTKNSWRLRMVGHRSTATRGSQPGRGRLFDFETIVSNRFPPMRAGIVSMSRIQYNNTRSRFLRIRKVTLSWPMTVRRRVASLQLSVCLNWLGFIRDSSMGNSR
jgi:hypothetical protein